MTDLPPGWEWTTLSEIADTTLGKMLDRGKSRGHPEVYYLRNVNVQWGRIDTDDLRTMEISPSQLEQFSLIQGDLLVCEGGEVGRAAIWPGSDTYVSFQKALHRVRPHECVSSGYLLYALRRMSETGQLRERATGSTIKHLPQEQLRELPIPLPPLAEQHRIVAELEEISASVTRLRRAAELAAERARDLFHLILADAFSGGLTHQDPSDEPASVLLQRIRVEHARPQQRRTTAETRQVRP